MDEKLQGESAAEHPLIHLLTDAGVIDRVITLMIEGRNGEVLCFIAPYLGPLVGLTTSQTDKGTLDVLTAYVWERIKQEDSVVLELREQLSTHPMMPHIGELVQEKAPLPRVWAMLEGLVALSGSSVPRLHSMMIMNQMHNEAHPGSNPTVN